MSGDLVAARENNMDINLNPTSSKRKTVTGQDKRHQAQCGKFSLKKSRIFFHWKGEIALELMTRESAGFSDLGDNQRLTG